MPRPLELYFMNKSIQSLQSVITKLFEQSSQRLRTCSVKLPRFRSTPMSLVRNGLDGNT